MKSRDVLCLTCGFLAGVVATAGIAVYAAKKTFEFFNVGLIKDKMADMCLTAIYGESIAKKRDKYYQYRRPYSKYKPSGYAQTYSDLYGDYDGED